MGRKKKNFSTNAIQNSPSVASEDDKNIPPADVLELRLVRPVSSKGTPSRSTSSTQQQDSLLYLSQNDAHRLDVVNHDQVLVLSRVQPDDGAPSVLAAAMCSARVHASSGTPSKRNLTTGHCRVTPTGLADRLCETRLDAPQEAITGAVTPSATASPPKTPSSSKSTFSFAKGGGGDALISPSTKTPSTPTPSKRMSSLRQYLWVVPLHSTLGAKLQSFICREATSIHLTPLCALEATVWSSSSRILKRLVMASSVGRYYRVHDTLQSSFQGQPVNWEINSIRGTPSDCTSLKDKFEQLNIEDEPELELHHEVMSAVRNSMNHKDDLCLYKIGYNTEIVLTADKEDVSDVDAVDSADNAAPEVVVAGLDATLENVKSLLTPPLLRPEMFNNGSLRPPRGVLLHGPSGVGKSILAKQVAMDLQHHSGVRVETINCTSLQSHTVIVGEAERHLTRMFRSAEKNQGGGTKGTLIVMDDVHLICPKRGGGGSSAGSDRLAATLLALMDGIGGIKQSDRQNVVILAVTSNPSLLDPALRRPGRLDTEVEVPIPDELTRAAILKFQLDRISGDIDAPLLSNTEISALARLAKGFNGADCMLTVKEAMRTAMVRKIENQGTSAETDIPLKVQLTLQDLQSAIRATKPTTIKSITVEIPQVHWTSIGGMDSVKQSLREAIELPLTHAHLFEALHIPPPRGVLLYGPPGCSKTLMARALATEGHMNFLAVKGPELLSKWLGESERALASLFRRARMASPCIIFFDEIDAIATMRGSGGNSGGERLLSQLLTELDGINSPGSSVTGNAEAPGTKRVIVVGATNRPDLLDSALMRPGRIDRMIYVGLPDSESRARILEIGLKGRACNSDIDIPSLAKDEVTGGFSGAEVIAICREAALFAIEEDDENSLPDAGSPEICMKHLLRAVQGVQRQITPEMLDFYASFRNQPSS